MTLLTQNAKMKKSSRPDLEIYNFGIPAFLSQSGIKTCPNAGVCATGCYARSGTYRFSNVAKAYEARLEFTQSDQFSPVMTAEIALKYIRAKAKDKNVLIRIHDSGDFYDLNYWLNWKRVIESSPKVQFYAYTKMVEMFKSQNDIPNNFRLIYSFGGKQDHMIDLNSDRHSRVFETLEDLKNQGYSDASNDDLVAALGDNPKIGLVYHGAKNYSNTRWKES